VEAKDLAHKMVLEFASVEARNDPACRAFLANAVADLCDEAGDPLKAFDGFSARRLGIE
jgi:hypothetical protein